MEINIENIPSCQIAYIRRVGAYGEGNIQAMGQLKQWAKANSLMDDDAVLLGIARDNPQATLPENCRYDACILVSNPVTGNNIGVQYDKISGGKYAVFTIEHTAATMEQAWAEIFPALAQAGYIPDLT